MPGSGLVPPQLGGQVRQQVGRAQVAHPVERVRAAHAVLDVLVRPLRRLRGSAHSAHRTAAAPSRRGSRRGSGRRWTAAGAVLGLLLPAALLAATAPSAGAASPSGRTTFTVALTGDVDSLNPF